MNTYPIQKVIRLPKHSVNFKAPQIEVEEMEDQRDDSSYAVNLKY